MAGWGGSSGGSPMQPIYIFHDAKDFEARHRRGTEVEFNNEESDIEGFNKNGAQFRTWIIARLSVSGRGAHWLFLVAPGDKAEWRFPKEGESCKIKLLSNSGKTEKSDWWQAERIDNPAAGLGLPEECLRFAAFEVIAPRTFPLKPMHEDDEDGPDLATQAQRPHLFSDKRAKRITIELKISKTSMEAELSALDTLMHNSKGTRSYKQEGAFNYLMNFRNPGLFTNLFYHFPHLKDPLNNPQGLPQRVVSFLRGFNEHQRAAYRFLLGNIPSGICILPGGPGAGKTHWNLILTCAIQAKNVVVYGPDETSNKSAKVLYLLDINKPLDDTANKIVRLYKELGLEKTAVRLYGWPYGKQDNPRFMDKFLVTARMKRFTRNNSLPQTNCMAPTLDEAVWDYFEQNKAGKYRDFAFHLATALQYGRNAVHDDFKQMVHDLYLDALDNIDFVATTPVPAANGLAALFKPDLVIFDESPHARELSTLIAIANYEPLAWIFSGDHRQTRPFVASDDWRDNPFAPQMLVSTMERAARAGAVERSLLINHRAFGGLERLASAMFYDNTMISGHKEQDLHPPTVRYLQGYLERFMEGRKCTEPRLIVCTDHSREIQQGTSWYNEGHMAWVIERAQELLRDPMFKRVNKTERGTILIIAPYKEAFHRYKHAVRDLPADLQQRFQVESRLEARTIDTVQGNEADVVFLDFVRHQGTEFIDHPNRLCVALTRARQAEIIMMNPGVCTKGSSSVPAVNLTRIWNHSASLGQTVRIRKGGALMMNGVAQTWKPRILPLPPGVPQTTIKTTDNMSQATAVSTRPAPASTGQLPAAMASTSEDNRPQTVASMKTEPARANAQVPPTQETRRVLASKPTSTAGVATSCTAAVKTIRQDNVDRSWFASEHEEQTQSAPFSWGDDEVGRMLDELTRVVPERRSPENDPNNRVEENHCHKVQHPHHTEVDAPRRGGMERPLAPVNNRVSSKPVKTKEEQIIDPREALPSGSDWW